MLHILGSRLETLNKRLGILGSVNLESRIWTRDLI